MVRRFLGRKLVGTKIGIRKGERNIVTVSRDLSTSKGNQTTLVIDLLIKVIKCLPNH